MIRPLRAMIHEGVWGENACPPSERDVLATLRAFAIRASILLAVGLLFAAVPLALLAVVSGNPIGLFAATTATCAALIAVYHFTVVNTGESVAHAEGENVASAVRPEPAGPKATQKRLLALESSLRVSAKSLGELEGRVVFLQHYMESLLEDRQMAAVDAHTEVEAAIQQIQSKIEELTTTIERLSESAGESLPRPTNPR